MALQITSQSPKLMQNVGNYSQFATGIAGGSGTSTSVTISHFTRVDGVIATSATSATAVYVGTTSGNSFTATHGSGDTIMYIAWGIPKA